jgi:SSS family solute:Na+ symporter
MINWVALIVFVLLFALVTVLGFVAANWRRGDLDLLHEWGLAGRRFGTVVTWFLLGGDLYTAYTFIAVPALVFGSGAIGFFALPYTIIAYPLVFVFMPRLWSVARKHGYITASDFVRGRFGSQTLALVVALTGILATMPYIALQLVGIQVVLAALGLQFHVAGAPGPVNAFLGDLPLLIAFVILAAYTYTSGLRAPAMIAVVKDTLIYITVLAAVIIIPAQLGGYGALFSKAPPQKLIFPAATPTSLGPMAAYSTLALGSALALFLYPHAVTGSLASSSRDVIKRNTALLPAYSFLLGLIALLGYMALASGVSKNAAYAGFFAQYGGQFAVPALFLQSFPAWFAGFAFAAVAIGALVPAAIMSIAAANLFTRNIYREYINRNPTDRQESQVAKITSLVVKVGALFFILLLPLPYAIQLQLLGGVWIIQTLPAVVLGLYTRWFHRWALIIGWAVGMVVGTWMAYVNSTGGKSPFASSTFPLQLGGLTIPGYAALYSLILNIVVAAIFTYIFNATGQPHGADETREGDYEEDAPAPQTGLLPDSPAPEAAG